MHRKTIFLLAILSVAIFLPNSVYGWHHFNKLCNIESPGPGRFARCDGIPKMQIQLDENADSDTFRAFLNGQEITDNFESTENGMTANVGLDDGLNVMSKSQTNFSRFDARGWNTLWVYVRGENHRGRRFGRNSDFCFFQVKVDIAEEIRPEGGKIEINDSSNPLKGVAVEIPEDAVDEDTLITVTEVDSAEDLPDHVKDAGIVANFSPDGVVFNTELRITMPYNDEDNDGIIDGTNIEEKNVAIYYYDEDMERWFCLKKVDQDKLNNTVTCTTDHFCNCKVGSIDSSIYGRDDVAFFTIDGCDLYSTLKLPLEKAGVFWDKLGITEGPYFNSYFNYGFRSAYLKPALIEGMSLGLNDNDVYSFGGGENESWSGEANDTKNAVPRLHNVLRSQYNLAKNMQKKFVLLTHSWGTVLGTLALQFSETEPDLFITLSSPLGTNQNTQGTENNFIGNYEDEALIDFRPNVGAVQKIVEGYVDARAIETIKVYDSVGKEKHPVNFHRKPNKEWINYWAMGDIISGPLASLVTGIQDIQIDPSSTPRNLKNTLIWHAITSLDDRDGGSWDKYVYTIDNINYRAVAESFRSKVETAIKDFINENETPEVNCDVFCVRFPKDDTDDLYAIEAYIKDPDEIIQDASIWQILPDFTVPCGSLTFNLHPEHPNEWWTDPNIEVSQGSEPDFPLNYDLHINFKDGSSQTISFTVNDWEWAETGTDISFCDEFNDNQIDLKKYYVWPESDNYFEEENGFLNFDSQRFCNANYSFVDTKSAFSGDFKIIMKWDNWNHFDTSWNDEDYAFGLKVYAAEQDGHGIIISKEYTEMVNNNFEGFRSFGMVDNPEIYNEYETTATSGYFRLVRSGDQVTSSYSFDGNNWQELLTCDNFPQDVIIRVTGQDKSVNPSAFFSVDIDRVCVEGNLE